MKRADILTLMVLLLYLALFIALAVFLAVYDDRVLAHVLFGNNLALWRETTTIFSYIVIAVGFAAFGSLLVLLGSIDAD